MPALSVSVDGQHFATVATGGLTMLVIDLFGNRWDDNLAVLDMHGSSSGSDEGVRHLTWINLAPVRAGQVIAVSCVAELATSPAGKTVGELFPDQPACEQTDFTPSDAMFTRLRTQPMLRDGYAFQLTTSTGIEYAGHTDADEYGFSLRVRWTALYRPECARFSVTSHTLEKLRTRAPSREHAAGDLWLGQGFRFQVWPAASA